MRPRRLPWTLAALALLGLGALSGCRTVNQTPAAKSARFDGATPLQWSVRMADSETSRRGDRLAWRPDRKVKWDYTAGLFTLSLLRLNEKVPRPDYVEFAKDAIGSFIAADGTIQGYKLEEYNIDNVAPGRTVLALYQLTGEERYRRCADLLRQQLRVQPRTSDGGFWHKQRYPWQMWLDGLFMGAPFYAEYTKLFRGPPEDYDDVVRQFQLIDRHLYDPKSGLFYHGWDEKRAQEWANPASGTSSNFWGRGLGWFAMAQVDVLDYLPARHPGRAEIVRLIRKTAEGIRKHQDAASGLWWQVLDQGTRPGNYLEASASAMFVYSLAKAVNQGYLSREYVPVILRGYSGLIERLIRREEGGRISLTQCCAVAGLGYGRDGSYEYYLREPVVENDLKGVGPFILAGIEVQKLLGLPMTASPDLAGKGPVAPSIGEGWAGLPRILARIRPPTIPRREFSIADFGAAAGGQTDCTQAIARAIDAAAKAGGGRVVVPPGEYLTGPIHLRSRVNLHLEEGATLKFTTNAEAYLPAVRTRFEGMDCWNYSPLIYAFEQHDIAITGQGVLDGQAGDDNWWSWKGRTGATNNQNAARARLARLVANNAPVDQRVFGRGDFLRPSFIQPYRCRNVLIEGVRIRRSPMWEVHPLFCTNVIVRGLDIQTHGPNNDGCNPECCRDVLIENTVFDTGDDCIAIKSGRNNDGRRLGLPTENVIVRGCTMKDGHGGVTMGSEISGGCRNVFVENCWMNSTNLDRVLRFKSNAVRGGVVENIFVRDVRVGSVRDAVLQIDFLYEEGTNGVHRPVVRNVVIERLDVQQAQRVLDIRGYRGAEIRGVRIHDSVFRGISRDDSVTEGDVKLVNCQILRE